MALSQTLDPAAQHLREKLRLRFIESDFPGPVGPALCGINNVVDHPGGGAWP
jgi:hypothetical protein